MGKILGYLVIVIALIMLICAFCGNGILFFLSLAFFGLYSVMNEDNNNNKTQKK